MRKTTKVLFGILLSSLIYPTVLNAASFDKYAPKLLRFEGAGYGIHKPIWGEKEFSKKDALSILRKNYWNRFFGNEFTNQAVAEVFIDHLINAGPGKNAENIKAFEAIIGVKQDGILTIEDVKRANSFYFPEQIVNPYVKYRILFYKSRKDSYLYPGWIERATSFLIKNSKTMTVSDIFLPKRLENEFSHITLDN